MVDDALIAMIVVGMVLAACYIRADLSDIRRLNSSKSP
jgi:hypothetical protein